MKRVGCREREAVSVGPFAECRAGKEVGVAMAVEVKAVVEQG